LNSPLLLGRSSPRRSGQVVIRSTLQTLSRELGAVSRATAIPQDILRDFIAGRTLLPPPELHALANYLWSGARVFDDFLDELRPLAKVSRGRVYCLR
jgi:hypothetical protein